MRRIVFFNCSIMTDTGVFVKEKTFLRKVKKIMEKTKNIESAIGHESTAEILTELTGRKIPVRRVKYVQQTFPEEMAIVFQLRSRPDEGKILTREEIEETGYDFYTVKRFESLEEI